MRRPTILDLAQASGVSVATVDRVLNGRHRVREETARRVYDAAQTIGYHAVGLLRQRIFEDLPQYRLGFVLQRPAQAFYQAFARELEAAAQAISTARVQVHIEFAAAGTPTAIVAGLKTVATRCQAVGLVGPDYPALTAAVEEMKARNIPVFTALSDLAPGIRDAYIGVDNRKFGRTAAWIIARAAARPGKIACFVGNHRFHGHELREIGFRSYFRENAPEFEVLETLVNLETAEITHEATINLVQKHPDLVGLYVCGGGMEGAISAIREEKLEGKLAVVVNELTTESKAALTDDTVVAVLGTPLPALCKEMISLMIDALSGNATNVPGQSFLPFDIFISENI